MRGKPSSDCTAEKLASRHNDQQGFGAGAFARDVNS
jgi:hypothetical protein